MDGSKVQTTLGNFKFLMITSIQIYSSQVSSIGNIACFYVIYLKFIVEQLKL